MLGIRGLPAPLRYYVLAVALAGPAAAGMLVAVGPARPTGADALRAALLVASAGLASAFPIRFEQKTNVDVTTAAFVAMILLFPVSVCGPLALLALVGGDVLRRSDPIEALFNLGQGTLCVVAGALGYSAVSALGAPDPQHDLLLGLGAVTFASGTLHAVNTALVAGVVARQVGARTARIWAGSVGDDLPAHAALTALGVAAALLADDHPLGLVLLVLPVGFVYTAVRHAAGQRLAAQRRAAEQEALATAGRAALSAYALPTVLGEVARAGLGVAGVDWCEIRLRRGEHDATELVGEARVADWPARSRPDAHHDLAHRAGIMAVLDRRTPLCFAAGDPTVPVQERDPYLANGVRGAVTVPLMLGDQCLGVLSFYSRQPLECRPSVRFARSLAQQAAQAIERARLHDELQERADTDPLTGLLNRRAILLALELEIDRAVHVGAPVAVLLVDVDDLKLVNDAHGHLVGDRVLREVSSTLRAVAPPRGLAGRYGGDEFLLVLAGMDAEGARRLANNLVDRAAAASIATEELRLPVRVSVGVAATPEDGAGWEELVAAADAAMYAVKGGSDRRAGAGEPATGASVPDERRVLIELARVVDRKNGSTAFHSELTARLAVRFGAVLGLPRAQLEALETAGWLHDIGKIAVPDAILRKAAALDEDEQTIVRHHVALGAALVGSLPGGRDILAAVAHHHERWDGRGYPSKKRGAEIPLLGRIMALADAYAAMVQDRPYRRALPRQEAIAELRLAAGGQFDPALVEPFIAACTTVDAGLYLGVLPRVEGLSARAAAANVEASSPGSLGDPAGGAVDAAAPRP